MSEGLDSALGGIVEFSVETAIGTVPERLLNGQGFEQIARRFDLQRVYYVADLLRDGAFASVGYRRSAVNAISDMWSINEAAAKAYVWAAENVCPRVSLEGQVLPPLLPVAAAAFASGEIGLAHVAEIVRVLASNEASRLTATGCVGVEERMVEHAALYRPSQLRTFGMDLVRIMDQDGPEPKDPVEVNELTITRHPDRPGGTIKGQFDNAVMFDRIATVVDAMSKPLTSDDQRGVKERQAEALADVCGQVLDRGDVPQCGGRRPQVNVIATLDELEHRARAATLDFGGYASARDLRMLCCDAAVIPIIMGSKGQPLDIGRASRTIPNGMRRAVAARDRGCARCGRPASWCEVHHIVEWENGGPTEINNLVMLCRVHHREIHATEWIVRIVDGLPEFVPPRWIDLGSTWIRSRDEDPTTPRAGRPRRAISATAGRWSRGRPAPSPAPCGARRGGGPRSAA